jgi:hypothetical protein
LTPVLVLVAVVAVLVAAFVVFYRHSRTPEWGDSESRKAVLRMMVVIGPIFGMHYREPRADVPAVTSVEPPREPLPIISDGEI